MVQIHITVIAEQAGAVDIRTQLRTPVQFHDHARFGGDARIVAKVKPVDDRTAEGQSQLMNRGVEL